MRYLMILFLLISTNAYAGWEKINDNNGGTYKKIEVLDRKTINELNVQIARLTAIISNISHIEYTGDKDRIKDFVQEENNDRDAWAERLVTRRSNLIKLKKKLLALK